MKMNKKGFTLVEMLVVIAIIAILVAILIPTVTGATTKAKEAADVANIRSAIAEYEIKVLSEENATKPTSSDFGLNFPAKLSVSDDGNTFTYTATKISHGSPETSVYTWTIGGLS